MAHAQEDRVRILIPVGYAAPGRVGVGEGYTGAITLAGGLPYLLSGPLDPGGERAALAGFGGLLLTGGGDLDPRYFDQLPHPALGEVEPARDRLEWALTQAALELGMPVLGICRGCQVLAARVGGDLYQDLASQFPGALQHAQKAPRDHESHPVRLEPGTLGRRILGDRAEIRTNSFHHQAVRMLPSGWRPFAWAPDGVLEGFEWAEEGRFALGVQWHPEHLVTSDPVHLALFTAFVAAARRFAQEGVRVG